MNNNPLISIITPCYNAGLFIEETILSVLAQTYQNFEMIIIDDCSTDNSVAIIEKYILQEARIKLLSNEHNIGVAKSRNKGINTSSGNYIALLDSDDIWFPMKLEKQIQFMLDKNILMSYSAYNTIDTDNNVIGYFPVREKTTYSDLLRTSNIGTLTMIYDVKQLGKLYFEDIGHEDYLLKLHILKKIPYAEGLSEVLASYRIADNSVSSNKFKAALWQWKIYRDIEKISLFKSVYYFLHYAYHGIFKYKSSTKTN